MIETYPGYTQCHYLDEYSDDTVPRHYSKKYSKGEYSELGMLSSLSALLDKVQAKFEDGGETFYFTFGQNHLWHNVQVKDYWVEIVAKDKKSAVEKMRREFW